MKRNEDLLREGGYGKLLLNLSLPSVVIMIVMVLYNMADVFFIGQLGDPYRIAAVGLAGPVFSALAGLGTLFGSGGCTAISLALGRGDREQAKKVSSLCFVGSLLLGLLFGGAILLWLDPLCRLLGTDEHTLAHTRDYMRIIACFAPVSLFSHVFVNLIRADGAAKVSMLANVLGTITNVILEPIFILVFHWGVRGAAIATGIGNAVGALMALRYVLRNRELYSLDPFRAKPDGKLAWQVFTLGLPMAFSTILMSVSHVISNKLLVSYDSIAVAAQSVAGKIGMLNSMLSMGICIGMQPAISYNHAAGNRARTREILRKTALTTVCCALLISLGCYLFRDALLTAFIDDASVLSIGRIALLASVAGGPIYGLYQNATTYFQATGKAGHATLCSLLDKGLIYIPVLYLLNALYGMFGVFFTGAATDALSLLAAAGLIVLSLRREKCFIAEPTPEKQNGQA